MGNIGNHADLTSGGSTHQAMYLERRRVPILRMARDSPGSARSRARVSNEEYKPTANRRSARSPSSSGAMLEVTVRKKSRATRPTVAQTASPGSVDDSSDDPTLLEHLATVLPRLREDAAV